VGRLVQALPRHPSAQRSGDGGKSTSSGGPATDVTQAQRLARRSSRC